MVASRLTRRMALAALAGTLVARNAFATPDQARDWIAAMAKGTPKDGKVSLKAPEIAENGNAVPLTVTVDSEMSEKSYVKAIDVAADGNPNPGVAVYDFTPLSGKAEVSLRARPGVVHGLGIWWRKLGLAGTNVNQLTSQKLTDMGRGPVFYDCLVDVQPG